MEIDVAGMKVSLDTKRAMVKIANSENGTFWEKQGVDVVLLFGILAALTKPTGKKK